MIQRGAICVALWFWLTTAGCTFFQYMDNSTPDEVKLFHSSKEEIWNQAKTLEKELADYQHRLAAQEAEANRINRDLTYWKNQTAGAEKTAADLSKTIDSLNMQLKQDSEVRQSAVPAVKETAPAVAVRPSVSPLKIKILAGGGKMASAERLSKKLSQMRYRVMRIDRAPEADFRVTTIFFIAKQKEAAATLARELGEGTISKPLSWPSAFDLIIVTGQNS